MERGFLSQKRSMGGRGGVTPSVVDMTSEMGIQNSLDDTTVLESFPPLSTPITTTTGNAPGKWEESECSYFVYTRGLWLFLGKKVAYPVVANYVRNT
ncbi:hypothetical protein Tco_0400034 [Tanacetum coccineum]